MIFISYIVNMFVELTLLIKLSFSDIVNAALVRYPLTVSGREFQVRIVLTVKEEE